MAHTSALHAQYQQDILKTIHDQLTISDDTLLNITRTFLREVTDGLSSYGHPMAMMYASTFTV
jgi:hexokinase